VTLLALIAGTVSYLHMHTLVELHGQSGWVAALTPLSVDGMIVAASTTLLADSRAGGERGGVLPWALLVVGSAASLAANIAVAHPTTAGRVIAAWPSFALIGAFTNCSCAKYAIAPQPAVSRSKGRVEREFLGRMRVTRPYHHRCIAPLRRVGVTKGQQAVIARRNLQRQAWEWALAHRAGDGSLPSGREIARQYGRHERWGRLVKRAGAAGEFGAGRSSSTAYLYRPAMVDSRRVIVARARPAVSRSRAKSSMSARRAANSRSCRLRHQAVNWRRSWA